MLLKKEAYATAQRTQRKASHWLASAWKVWILRQRPGVWSLFRFSDGVGAGRIILAMPRLISIFRLTPLLLMAGCATDAGTADRIQADRRAMPPNTVMLSQMMRELSAKPGFTEAVLQQIDRGQKNGAAFTPALFDLFRKLVLGKDWSGLDRFPGWTIHQVTRTVNLSEGFMDKRNPTSADDMIHVQLGPYPLNKGEVVSLDEPSDRGAFSADGLVANISDDIVRGDGPDAQLAPMHAESVRFAEVLNRLSLNGFAPDLRVQFGEPAQPFAVTMTMPGSRGPLLRAESPQQLISLLQHTGHKVTVADSRFFANFGHFHYRGQDVEMPFWLDSGISVPPVHWWSKPRPYLIPVAHAEYEWIITGPKMNADVSFYFGIDGRAEFRTNDQKNQAWVLGRHAHEYRDADAVEVTRLTGQMLRAYAYLHLRYPQFPFGGYYTMGVCQDAVAAIEQRMTGTITIYPNTANTVLFKDQPDAEIYRLMEAIPKDTAGRTPTPERIFGSLPTTDYAKLTVPGLREDTERTDAAWKDGTLTTQRSLRGRIATWAGLLFASALVVFLMKSRAGRRAA